jgi:hypothetical protein
MKRRALGINIGTVSIVLIFTVLCLTIFSVLTLISARNELRLARRATEASLLYYRAELTASERLCEIKNCIIAGRELPAYAESYASGGVTYIAYSVEIDPYRLLAVALAYEDGEVTVLSWRTADSGLWEPENYLDFFIP